MLTKRIIPCLDVKDGRTVKGINFVGLRDVGDPVELGARYAREGADELVYLDITATHEGRKTLLDLVTRLAQELDIPFTVGGGVGSVADVEALLQAGADKVSLNSAAVRNPSLVNELARRFGSQCIVVAIDSRYDAATGQDIVYVAGGRTATDKELHAWSRECADRGAGELLLTSMDHDGTKAGFANAQLSRISPSVPIPIIASGGAGTREHFRDVFQQGKADAALAASVFHYNEIPIPQLKDYLAGCGIAIRAARA